MNSLSRAEPPGGRLRWRPRPDLLVLLAASASRTRASCSEWGGPLPRAVAAIRASSSELSSAGVLPLRLGTSSTTTTLPVAPNPATRTHRGGTCRQQQQQRTITFSRLHPEWPRVVLGPQHHSHPHAWDVGAERKFKSLDASPHPARRICQWVPFDHTSPPVASVAWREVGGQDGFGYLSPRTSAVTQPLRPPSSRPVTLPSRLPTGTALLPSAAPRGGKAGPAGGPSGFVFNGNRQWLQPPARLAPECW
ncbi:unnamed protein product [Lampetra planeri]